MFLVGLLDISENYRVHMDKSDINTSQKLEKSDIRLEFPEALPVSGQRQVIMDALRAHQVVIVCGETGSGKTTQLPKICLAMGRGRLNGTGKMIAHTQPRRIAATSTAKRIAQELGTPIGQDVGYQVRFADKSSTQASIKLMTDGILLAQTQNDPLLKAYDTIIIDEAHERSLNIDFLLGYFKQILPKRPDLKIIITSATIDAQRFANHFVDKANRPAPIIEVSGRLFPVELRYRPLLDSGQKEPKELSDAVIEAVTELWRQGVSGAGDVLVFLPGEREIRDCAEALRKDHFLNQRFHPEILSLFARQSVSEQERVFQASSGRRIVLATNVAETSLTVPGIRFVVDSGLARVKRYSYRNKVEQLQIEPISQAAANQRAGRCGRVADGICIRLYDEGDFKARPEFTDPEILRSSLAAVILRMVSLKLSRIQDFPFLQVPLGRAISDGVQLLEELGAMESIDVDGTKEGILTEVGRQLAKLPLDPRVGRILLAARDHLALREVLIITSALACQDPRDRPMDQAQAADTAHRQFADEKSEFLSYVKLWDWYQDALVHKQSNRQLENLVKSKFLSPRRMREWRDVHGQIHHLLMEQGWKENGSPATYEQVHLALLTGLLGNIAKKSEDDALYEGARGIKLHLWPGSTLGKKAGAWILGAELVDTSRLFIRTIAKIDPSWVEKVAAHRIAKSWSDPFWDSRQGEVMAHERGSLYGIPIYHGRKVRFAPNDPKQAREIMIQRALVEGELFGANDAGQIQKQYGQTFGFFWHNQNLIRQIEALEHRSRRQDVLIDDTLLFAFYEQKIPDHIVSRAGLQAWLDEDERHRHQLKLNKEDLMRHEAAGITVDRYPKVLQMAGTDLQLTYHFEPGSPKDGVTLVVPMALLNQIDARRCEWLVPGLCAEKIQLYLKTLPQKLRRNCVPLPEFSKNFVEQMVSEDLFGKGDLLEALMSHIRAKTQVIVQRSDFRPENLPSHVFMNFRLLDQHGRQLELERHLDQLRAQYGKAAREEFKEFAANAVSQVAQKSPPSDSNKIGQIAPEHAQASKNVQVTTTSNDSINVDEIKEWSFGELPEMLEIRKGKQVLFGYPALVDRQTHCELEVFDDPEHARLVHRQGLRRLFSLPMRDTLKALQKQLPGARELGLLFMQIGRPEDLVQQILDFAIERSCMFEPLPVNATQFKERLSAGKPKLALIAGEIARHVLQSLEAYSELQKKLSQVKALSQNAFTDLQNQARGLVYAQFVSQTPYEYLVHLPRYLKGAILRIEKLRVNPARDAQSQNEWQLLYQGWEKLKQSRQSMYGKSSNDPRLEDFRWQLEELRIALFAQELKTPTPMSSKRLQKILDSLRT